MNKQSKEIPVKLKGWKRWAFPLAAMVLIPALFFILLELGLKVAGYGFPTPFLIKRKVADETVYTDNRQYGWRFFPSRVARRPADIVLPAVKSDKTYRVFVLGESAAMGDPDTAYGIPRMLEVMLSERFPSVKFEVVNAAMTGISSHIIQDIAKDCAKFQPDCFVIYMGNNEAIGPYGPGTVFASFSRNLALTRLSINARSLKTSQLVDGIMKMRSKTDQPEGWGGLRVFMKSQLHPTDERVALLAKHFESNLTHICETGRKAGANLVLCTVASSLADCSPFGSLNAPTLSLEQKNEWDAHYSAADKFEAEGRPEEALAAYKKAEAIDASFAELHFRKGRLYESLKRSKEAQESFTLARDTDSLKFRTSSDLNKRIKELAQALPATDVALADVVKVIEEESADKGVGSGHFVDHVHFNFHGNYVAAREIFNAVSRFVPGSAGAGGAGSSEVLSEQACAERLAFSRWNQRRITEHMLKRFEIPPFNTKSDFNERVHELKAQLAILPDINSTGAVQEALALYERALQRKKTDPDFLRNLAELQGELDKPTEEVKYREALFELYPYDLDRKALLAEAYARSGNYPEGEKLAREVLKDDSTHFIAHMALGSALEKKGSLEAAIAEYKEVLRWRPDLVDIRRKVEALERGGGNGPVYASPAPGGTPSPASQEGRSHYLRGEEFLQKGRIDEALSEFRTAVALNPSLAEAHMGIAGIFVEQGKVEQAIAQCKEGLRARPDFTEMHSNVGALLTDLGRRAEARTHLEAAIRLDPNHADAHLNLALNLMGDKQPVEALKHFEFFIKKNPNEPDIHLQMGILYESTGSWDKAAQSYRQALRIQPANIQYQSFLAWILATSPEANIRNGKEALQLAEAACRAPTKQAYTLDTLAAAFAETDQFAEAIKTAEDALALARAAKDDQMATDIDKRIALYKSNKPFRSEITHVPVASQP